MIRLAIATVVAVVTAPTIAASVDQGLTGPDTAPVYTLIEHRLEGDWQTGQWTVSPPLQPGAQWRVSADGLSVLWTAPPGRYTLHVVSVNWEQRRLAQWSKGVVVGEPGPGPTPPGPEPGPTPPDPGPTPTKYQVVIILESGALDNLPSGQLEVVASRKFREALVTRGHQLVAIVDKDTPPSAILKPFFAAASGRSLPVLLRAPIGGGTIEVMPLPDSIQATLDALSKAKWTATTGLQQNCPSGTCPLPSRW